ncbi:MAG: DUF4136 domain-containing protein [Nevskiaceae bacterium]|jgi:hypothetical protein|nr:DUF4136 domain-containing protein [Nevskiaceae bacterium]
MNGIKTVLITACALALTACASSSGTVRSDAAPGMNFAQFKTWGFLTPSAAQQRQVSPLAMQQIQDSLRAQMTNRGFVYAEENPDLLVNFDVVAGPASGSSSRPRMGVSVGAGGGSYGSGVGVGISLSNLFGGKRKGTPGTLSVDLVDRAHNQMIWTGSFEGEIASNDRPTYEVVDSAVNQVFSRFPAQP